MALPRSVMTASQKRVGGYEIAFARAGLCIGLADLHVEVIQIGLDPGLA